MSGGALCTSHCKRPYRVIGGQRAKRSRTSNNTNVIAIGGIRMTEFAAEQGGQGGTKKAEPKRSSHSSYAFRTPLYPKPVLYSCTANIHIESPVNEEVPRISSRRFCVRRLNSAPALRRNQRKNGNCMPCQGADGG